MEAICLLTDIWDRGPPGSLLLPFSLLLPRSLSLCTRRFPVRGALHCGTAARAVRRRRGHHGFGEHVLDGFAPLPVILSLFPRAVSRGGI